jgi:ABC-type branched-subunit amino acid transport system substrate-binding protein
MKKWLAVGLVAVFAFAGIGSGLSYGADNIKIAKIGWVVDMTGPISMYGQPITHAAQWAVDYINKVLYPDGMPIGKDKYHFELVVEDYGGKMEEAPTAGQLALDQKPFAMCMDLGFFLEPLYPKLAQMKIPLMITHSPFMTEKLGGWVFRYRNTPTQVMPATASYVVKNFGVKRPSVYSETGEMGTAGGKEWVESLVKAGIPRADIQWQQYKIPLAASQFLPYLTKSLNEWHADVIVQGATGPASGTPQACATYLQAKQMGYKGYFCSYTGMTDVEARKVLGSKYASYIGKVYQGEGVDAYTNPDPKVRQWGKEFFAKYGEYPIDLVPWGWDEIMVLVSAAYNAGTVTDGDKYREALAKLPFDFVLKNQLKTPMSPQRGDKLFDSKGQALMEVMVCGWTPEGIKVPKAFMFVDEKTMEIKSTTYPKKELIDSLIREWHDRNK